MAERSFDLSLSQVKDHQSLYYRALSILKQLGRCQDEINAWQDYLNFCKHPETSCVESWVPKAKKHLERAQDRCQKPTSFTKNTSIQNQNCPYGSADLNGPCLPPPPAMKELSVASKRTQPQQKMGILEALPWWFYLGTSVGILSHIINYQSNEAFVLDLTYYTTIAGYISSGAGVGVALYRLSTQNQVSTPAQTQLELPDLHSDLSLPKVHWLLWQFEF